MNITYILGAGFSRPLGVPVMSEFLEFARHIFDQFPNQYPEFAKIFRLIQRLHSIKEYTEQDLTNIEVILSILEMSNFTRSDIDSLEYKNFIKQVVDFYSPKHADRREQTRKIRKDLGNWMRNHNGFRQTEKFPYYVWLMALLGMSIHNASLKLAFPENLYHNVNIITLNYDLIVESIFEDLDFLIKEIAPEIHEEFLRRRNNVKIIHLHGDINSEIIPPIWTKTIDAASLEKWKTAAKLLNEANFVHFLGYSLPVTDGYFRFFLSVSLMDNVKLQKIKALCLDPAGMVKEQYEAIFAPISQRKFVFAAENVIAYLERYRDCFNRDDLEQSDGSAHMQLTATSNLLKRHLSL